MRAMGVDLSSRSLAMVTRDEMGILHVKKYKCKDAVKSRQAIAIELYYQALDELQFSTPEAVYIEEPVVAGVRNVRSSLLIAQVCGVMMAACAASGMEKVYLIPVSSWKKGALGDGNGGADKSRVRSWLYENHPQAETFCRGDQDLIDATCIAIHGQGLLSRVNDISSGLSHGAQLPKLA